MWILNSYVNIDLDKATEKYNEIHEYITKEITAGYIAKQGSFCSDIEIYKQIADKAVNSFMIHRGIT